MNDVERSMWWRIVDDALLVLAMVAAALLLGACSTLVTVQTTCDPPPIKPELLVPCEEAIMPTGRTYEEFYGNAVANVAGPWSRCVRKDDQLIAVLQYQQEFCKKLKADAEKQASKHWWEF